MQQSGLFREKKMGIKIRTVIAFLLLFSIALTLVRLELFQWAFVLLSTVFLFVSAVMFAGYLKFSRQEKKLLSELPSASVLVPCYNRQTQLKNA
jgi:cellulose synthase/poly-beta-1,6-N-acetylglucosamine synthase-like glycosyltransferase